LTTYRSVLFLALLFFASWVVVDIVASRGDRVASVVITMPTSPVINNANDDYDVSLLAIAQNDQGQNMLHAAAIAELEWRTGGQAPTQQCSVAETLGKNAIRMYTISHWLSWDLMRRQYTWRFICEQYGVKSMRCAQAKRLFGKRRPEIPAE
jgi:hypothetical protein